MDNLVVQTKNGKIEGFADCGIRKWYGIPYAKPPVGELRFKRAVPAEEWKETKACKSWGNRPIQFSTPELLSTMGISEAPGMSEDCLTLNVFAPEEVKDAPVVV